MLTPLCLSPLGWVMAQGGSEEREEVVAGDSWVTGGVRDTLADALRQVRVSLYRRLRIQGGQDTGARRVHTAYAYR